MVMWFQIHTIKIKMRCFALSLNLADQCSSLSLLQVHHFQGPRACTSSPEYVFQKHIELRGVATTIIVHIYKLIYIAAADGTNITSLSS